MCRLSTGLSGGDTSHSSRKNYKSIPIWWHLQFFRQLTHPVNHTNLGLTFLMPTQLKLSTGLWGDDTSHSSDIVFVFVFLFVFVFVSTGLSGGDTSHSSDRLKFLDTFSESDKSSSQHFLCHHNNQPFQTLKYWHKVQWSMWTIYMEQKEKF